ncbi:helix-turn-helix transcriptional regulator [Deinococcus sp. YIM 134068]|uniref:helix-turn-helix transcriptional regulator n=1 Tax=Deinococcus lichenicola TaxID=3118910 RepID=UPI002F93E496
MTRRPRKKREVSPEVQAFQVALGQRVRELRKPKYSQDEFAAEVDVFRSHMGTIEQGKSDLRLSTLLRIAAALGMTVSELLDLSVKGGGLE